MDDHDPADDGGVVRVCGTCGASSPAGARWCGRCGAGLPGRVPADAPAGDASPVTDGPVVVDRGAAGAGAPAGPRVPRRVRVAAVVLAGVALAALLRPAPGPEDGDPTLADQTGRTSLLAPSAGLAVRWQQDPGVVDGEVGTQPLLGEVPLEGTVGGDVRVGDRVLARDDGRVLGRALVPSSGQRLVQVADGEAVERDAGTGRVVGRRPLPASLGQGTTVAGVTDELVLLRVRGPVPSLVAVDEGGDVAWSRELDGFVEGVSDGVVRVFRGEGPPELLDAASGDTLVVPLDVPGGGPSDVVVVGDVAVAIWPTDIRAGDDGTVAFDPTTGEVLWREPVVTQGQADRLSTDGVRVLVADRRLDDLQLTWHSVATGEVVDEVVVDEPADAGRFDNVAAPTRGLAELAWWDVADGVAATVVAGRVTRHEHDDDGWSTQVDGAVEVGLAGRDVLAFGADLRRATPSSALELGPPYDVQLLGPGGEVLWDRRLDEVAAPRAPAVFLDAVLRGHVAVAREEVGALGGAALLSAATGARLPPSALLVDVEGSGLDGTRLVGRPPVDRGLPPTLVLRVAAGSAVRLLDGTEVAPVEAAPLLAAPTFAAARDGRLLAGSTSTPGLVLLDLDVDGAPSGAPVVVRGVVPVALVDGVAVVVDAVTGGFRGLDATDGDDVWDRPDLSLPPATSLPPGADALPGAVVAADGTVVVAGAVRLQAFSAADGASAWSADTDGLVLAAPVLVGDLVVVATSTGLVAHDVADGRVAWRTPAPVTAAAGAGDRVVVGTTEGEVLVVGPDGTVEQRVAVGARVTDVAAVDDLVVALRADRVVVGLGPDDGTLPADDRIDLGSYGRAPREVLR